MKVEVQFVGSSIDSETYEAEQVSWVLGDGQLAIFTRGSKGEAVLVASYPENRVVRVRRITQA